MGDSATKLAKNSELETEAHELPDEQLDSPLGSGDGGTERLVRVDTGLVHHVVARVEVFAFLLAVSCTLTSQEELGRPSASW